MADVLVDGINKSFGDTHILRDITLEARDGEFVVIVGPSGCGKSMLLRAIAGLEDVTSGRISIDGQVVNELPPSQRQVAMVFQSYALYPHMNVRRNLGFGLRFSGMPRDEIEARVQRAAKMLQIDQLLTRMPRELSGGQRQRVAIGRAIVRNPKVFLFDEPLSNLDAALRVKTRIELAQLQKSLNATVIYVTHDQVEAMTLADRIIVMSKGRIEQTGSPLELYHRPANLFVASFIGSPSMSILQGEVRGLADNRLAVSLPEDQLVELDAHPALEAALGQQLQIGIRPEHVKVGGNGSIRLGGKVRIVERLGELGYAYVELGDGRYLVAEVRGEETPRPGQSVTCAAHSQHVHVFSADGRALRAGAQASEPMPAAARA